jgi:hypothetical protein
MSQQLKLYISPQESLRLESLALRDVYDKVRFDEK